MRENVRPRMLDCVANLFFGQKGCRVCRCGGLEEEVDGGRGLVGDEGGRGNGVIGWLQERDIQVRFLYALGWPNRYMQ
jgi:hypothetical protein